MRISATNLIFRIRNKLSSSDPVKVVDDFDLFDKRKETIHDCLQKGRIKENKKYVFDDILSKFFSLVIELYFKSDFLNLRKIAGMCNGKLIDNDRVVDSAFVNSLMNLEKKESLGFFIINMIYELKETEYQKIFMDVVDKKWCKEINNAIVSYFLSLEPQYINRLERIPIFFHGERLAFVTTCLLERLKQVNNLENVKRVKLINTISRIFEIIFKNYGQNVYFQYPIVLSYVGGLFDGIGMEGLSKQVADQIKEYKDYENIINLAIENKASVFSKIHEILQKQDEIIDEKEKKRDQIWKQRLEEEKLQYINYLCEVSSRLYQLINDAEKQNIDTNSVLYQRISVTVSYLEGILDSLGVETIGHQGDILKFDRDIHESLNEIITQGEVEIVVPGFRFKRINEKVRILKKSIVSLNKEIRE
jgi:molecular chaperone GrpE (heat shock protein)